MKRALSSLVLAVLITAGCHTAEEAKDLPRGEVSSEWSAAAEDFREEAVTKPGIEQPYSIMVVDHGKVVFEQWYGGLQPESTMDVYSISKTVLALATGCAVEEGLISVDDKVTGFFPDKLPENVSDTLSSMTIRHLLTMTCGLEETPRLMSAFGGGTGFDWISEFFASRQAYMPGTQFYYNFFTPYILSAIIEKKAGTGLMDYIRPRLLEPMHITDMEWKDSPEGICVGGWGMYVSIEDVAKVGQLLLQHGEWNGRQLVPRQWVDTMTSNLVKSIPFSAMTKIKDPALLDDPEDDHAQGYGYYVWQGKNGSCRMEGLYGNLAFIDPEAETVVVVNTTSRDQAFIGLIWDHFAPKFQ